MFLGVEDRRAVHSRIARKERLTQPAHAEFFISEMFSEHPTHMNVYVCPYVVLCGDLRAYIKVRHIFDQPLRVWQWPEVSVVAKH